MEVRVLRYFLAVAREESVTGAAEIIHVTQPTLSKQLIDLEKELGKKLFDRGNRKITLTEEGMILWKRAQEIIDLVDKGGRIENLYAAGGVASNSFGLAAIGGLGTHVSTALFSGAYAGDCAREAILGK